MEHTNAAEKFRTVRVAAVQAESVFLDLDATTEKACRLIEQAGANGADLIAFPEAFIPTFPNWYETLGESPRARNLDKRLFMNSVEIPGKHINAIASACKKANINAVVGVNERLVDTTGTMFNTQVHITRDGEIVGKHQKYVPTSGERQVHMQGKTGYYNAFKTDFGSVSGLICAENMYPLAQYAAGRSYPVVHVASWPTYFAPYFPMHHSIVTTTAGLAYSLKCFVVNAVSRIPEAYIEAVAPDDDSRNFLLEQRELKKGAVIIDHMGRVIVDGSGSAEELLFADLNLEELIAPKMIIDFAGHYDRPEIFAPLFRDE
ncbi:carbon-nitrogen hydrolase family protein [Burkholderia sp. BCC1977]|uniref:carbon-nitrogen hydrolase family protein n=1 Tax=Burkholderia sp. BCC1977 TaxID=2817440 RepID=UPI002ABDE7C9|nr:carbon-nitrogen hydrolase family protein [Burkholderia sp. BCC1977]